jgi:hypothetical protein
MAINPGLLTVAIANTIFVCALLLLGIYQFRATIEARMKRLSLYLAWVLVLLATSSIEIVVYLAILNGTELMNGIFLAVGLFGGLPFTSYYNRHIASPESLVQ